MYLIQNPKSEVVLCLCCRYGSRNYMPIYYFSKDTSNAVDFPPDYEVGYTKSGHPYLKRQRTKNEPENINSR